TIKINGYPQYNLLWLNSYILRILLLSPGPYATFKEEDILYFLGDEDCLARVKNFMYPKS
ncbi:MAG: hypothetical protein RR128_07820, partial [Clostridium sp.]